MPLYVGVGAVLTGVAAVFRQLCCFGSREVSRLRHAIVAEGHAAHQVEEGENHHEQRRGVQPAVPHDASFEARRRGEEWDEDILAPHRAR